MHPLIRMVRPTPDQRFWAILLNGSKYPDTGRWKQ